MEMKIVDPPTREEAFANCVKVAREGLEISRNACLALRNLIWEEVLETPDRFNVPQEDFPPLVDLHWILTDLDVIGKTLDERLAERGKVEK